MPVTSDGVGGSGAYAGAMANEGADAEIGRAHV